MVLPISFFEKDNQAYYNSIAIIDADGEVLGVYRKSHIPDGPGYEEKFYFNPGDTGFKVWNTKYCKLGVAICWDQWFPEAARIMTLMGAEVISGRCALRLTRSVSHRHRHGASGQRHQQQRPLETHDAGPLCCGR